MYDEFYQLSGMPFRLTPDPNFLFHSRGHSKALAYLRYGLQQGEGFVVVTGEVGAGKTTLIRALDSQLRMSNVVSAELVTTNLESDELLRMVAGGFGLGADGLTKTALIKSLETFMAARVREGKRVLLVIDEAHHLSVPALEELRMLANFQVGEKALLQTFLLGQGEFRDVLQSDGLEQFRQRVIAAHHLGPLGEDETRQYINHRLRVVSWRDNPRFTDQAYELIHKYSTGIPRQINTLCDRILLKGALDELSEITDAVVDEVWSEQKEELPKLSDAEKEKKASAKRPSAPLSSAPVSESAAQPAAVAVASEDYDRRIQSLERRVEELEAKIKKDQDRLQKLIMMAMLSGDDLDLSEVLQSVKRQSE